MIGIRAAHRLPSLTVASAVALAITVILLPAFSLAGSWPERIVRITTPSAAGSSVDVVARLFAERLAARWGQPVVIDNRPGPSGLLAVHTFLRARAGAGLLLTFRG